MFFSPMNSIRIGLLCLSATLAGLSLHAQTADDMTKEGDLLVKNLKEEDAYQKYKQALVVQSDNLRALTQCSYVATRIGARQKDKKKAVEFYTEGQDLAGRALKTDSTSSDASLMMAMAVGKLAQTESAKKRVEYNRDVKTYCEQAIRQDPKNYRAYYLLGMWNLQAAHMSGVERAEAKVLYGGMPQATIKDAIRWFEKCRSVYPSYMLNYLDLAKTYKEDDQNEKAIAALQVLVKLPVQTEDDPGIKAEGRTILEAMM
jgi:tetratricopeptide (TPR) repeat protein